MCFGLCDELRNLPGLRHAHTEFSLATEFPDNDANMPAEQREVRSVIGSGQCMIDDDQFYIRGCIEIPIHGHTDPFLWGV